MEVCHMSGLLFKKHHKIKTNNKSKKCILLALMLPFMEKGWSLGFMDMSRLESFSLKKFYSNNKIWSKFDKLRYSTSTHGTMLVGLESFSLKKFYSKNKIWSKFDKSRYSTSTRGTMLVGLDPQKSHITWV